jgi:hypothetical protein
MNNVFSSVSFILIVSRIAFVRFRWLLQLQANLCDTQHSSNSLQYDTFEPFILCVAFELLIAIYHFFSIGGLRVPCAF